MNIIQLFRLRLLMILLFDLTCLVLFILDAVYSLLHPLSNLSSNMPLRVVLFVVLSPSRFLYFSVSLSFAVLPLCHLTRR